VRTSENLALFYADMARRQIVLEPVVRQLGLRQPWFQVRDRVSAVVPATNLRLVTVTVMGADPRNTQAIANGVVDQLVTMSPAVGGGNTQAFINEQADHLKKRIESAQRRIDVVQEQISASADEAAREQLEQDLASFETRVGEWQRIYVELIAAEPTSDAGGLQVIDEAAAVEGTGRSGSTRQPVVGFGVGATLGMLLVWWLHRRARRKGVEWIRVDLATAAEARHARTRHSRADEEHHHAEPREHALSRHAKNEGGAP
jgi:hypothetical protein